MKISTPEIKVIRFSSEDVIVASGPVIGSSGLFFIPSSEYTGYSGSSKYVEFNGTIGSQSSVGYLIENIYAVDDADPDDRAAVMSGGSYWTIGVLIPADVMETMAQNTYDAFSYNGQYYTNGESYYNQYWQ